MNALLNEGESVPLVAWIFTPVFAPLDEVIVALIVATPLTAFADPVTAHPELAGSMDSATAFVAEVTVFPN